MKFNLKHNENIKVNREIIRIAARRLIIISLIISLCIHLIVIFYKFEMSGRKVSVKKKPISVKFIQKAPRLVKPLELARRPTIVQRQLARRLSVQKSVTPRSMRTATIHGGTVLASLARVGQAIERQFFLPQKMNLGPAIIPQKIESTKETSVKKLEEDLLSARYLDTGRYKAAIVRDPENKKKISGYFHMDLLRYRTNHTRDWDGNPGWNSEPAALPNVAKAVESYTDIKMDFGQFITMDSDKLMNCPLVVLTGEAAFQYSQSEAENLGRYLRKGGFMFFDDSSDEVMIGSPLDRVARQLIKDALGSEIVFEKLPEQHPLYHIFFDFNGPPIGFDYRFAKRNKAPYTFLEGVFIDSRLAVLISNKAYCKFWDHAFSAESEHGMSDPTRQLQFGVNIVIFALTQPGGIVWQQMNYQ